MSDVTANICINFTAGRKICKKISAEKSSIKLAENKIETKGIIPKAAIEQAMTVFCRRIWKWGLMQELMDPMAISTPPLVEFWNLFNAVKNSSSRKLILINWSLTLFLVCRFNSIQLFVSQLNPNCSNNVFMMNLEKKKISLRPCYFSNISQVKAKIA